MLFQQKPGQGEKAKPRQHEKPFPVHLPAAACAAAPASVMGHIPLIITPSGWQGRYNQHPAAPIIKVHDSAPIAAQGPKDHPGLDTRGHPSMIPIPLKSRQPHAAGKKSRDQGKERNKYIRSVRIPRSSGKEIPRGVGGPSIIGPTPIIPGLPPRRLAVARLPCCLSMLNSIERPESPSLPANGGPGFRLRSSHPLRRSALLHWEAWTFWPFTRWP